MKSIKVAALCAAVCSSVSAVGQWVDVTLTPWHTMSSFSPQGTTPNDQRVLSGNIASQAWDLEAIAVNPAAQEISLIGGYNFLGYQGPATAIFLSTSVITSVTGSGSNGYQTVANPGFTYAIRLGANNQFDVYSLTSSSVVTAFYVNNRGLPTEFTTSTASRVGSGSYSLVNLVASQFTELSGLSFAGDSRYVLTLPLSALQGQSILSYNEWCGNDSLIGNIDTSLVPVPETVTSAQYAFVATIGGYVFARSKRSRSANPNVVSTT
jgi:hypothetical protein